LPNSDFKEPARDRRLLVLVCTYNERTNIERLIESICISSPSADLLIVDDSSPDGTAEIVRAAISDKRFGDRLKLKVRPGKQGLGSAIRDGLQLAMQEHYEFVLNLDADFSHNPVAIPSLLDAMKDTSIDLAIGSRYVQGGSLVNCSWKRKLVSKIANAYARLLLRWKIRDCSSAFRCYRVASLRRLPWDAIQCNGYGFLEEILWHVINSSESSRETNRANSNSFSPNVVEVPIIYTERERGDSKISLNEAMGTLSVLHKLWWSSKRV